VAVGTEPRATERRRWPGRVEGSGRAASTVRAGLVLLALGGLAPCVLFYAATRRIGWACLLFITFIPVIALPLAAASRAGERGGLRAFLGVLYLASGIWVVEWSLLPDLEGYLRSTLSSVGTLLLLLGIFIVPFRLLSSRPTEREGKGSAGNTEASGGGAGQTTADG